MEIAVHRQLYGIDRLNTSWAHKSEPNLRPNINSEYRSDNANQDSKLEIPQNFTCSNGNY